jgi:hypothetical protein
MVKLAALFAVFIAVVILAGSPVYGASPGGSSEQGTKLERLKDWHDKSIRLFELAGVVFTDANEETGRLVVGVESDRMANKVRMLAKVLGIPEKSMDLVESPQIMNMATLRNKVRPIQGGLQIAFRIRRSTYVCTMGFNAVRAGVQGYVTNSHCTSSQGRVDGTKHYQPTISSSNLIGTETVDPSFFTGGACPFLKQCRYSDTAFASLASGVDADLGYIEQTTGANNGSLTIAGSFRVVSESASNSSIGETINKVGRTTGWTQGSVSRSCVHTGVSGTRYVMLCQDWVNAGVGGGDSGSPVFKIVDGDDVELAGILWGGSSDGRTFVYSPMSNVQRSGEMGALTNCAAGSGC